MPYPWLEEYCLNKPWAVKEYKASWQATLYRVGGRIFGLRFKDAAKKPIINLKCDPFLALHYRTEYPHLAPGYHMNKTYWLSVYLRGNTPDEIVRELVDLSYELVFAKIPRRERDLRENMKNRGSHEA